MNTVKIDDKYIITSDGRVFTFWHNHKELAKIYGVARGVIYSIRKKKSYKEIV